MAKGKKIKNNIDNDFDFDSSLDFDDLDFGADPFKDDRKPATKVKDGLKGGIKSKAADPAFISGVLKELLPKGFGDTLDLGDKVSTSARQLYTDAANEVRPAISDFKRIAAKLAPKDSKYVPDKVKEILKQWEEESKANAGPAGTDARAQRESMITMQLGQIFEQQFAQTEKDKRESTSKDLIKEGIELNRHRDIFTVLNQSAVSLSRISQYQTSINLQYQKKSLELQHRQLFAQYDILETINKTHALQSDAFTKIVKNTALPEWQKINLSELSKQKIFSKFSDTVGTAFRGMMPNVDEYLQMTTRRIRDKAMGAIKSNVQGFRSALTEAESAKEQVSGMGDMIDKYQMGGEAVGEWGTDTLGYYLAKKYKDPLTKAFPKIEKAGDYLENMNENLVGSLNKFKRNPKWMSESGPKAWFMRTLQDILPNAGVDKSFSRITGKDLNAVQPFTIRTERSINEIIPGYLSRILQEMQIMRTGNPSVDRIEYDQDKGRFTSSRKILKGIATGLYTERNAKRTNSILDNIIDKIDTDENNKLSDEDKDKIKEAILKNKLQYRDINAGLGGKAGEATSSFLSGLEGNDREKLILNRQLNSLVRGMDDPRARIEQLISEGRQNELAELGIISRTDRGYELNMDTFYKGQMGKGRYDALNRKRSSVVPNAFGSGIHTPSGLGSFGVREGGIDYTNHFTQVTDRLDTSIEHYKEIIELIKTLMATGFKQGAKNDSLDNETDNLFTKGKFQYARAKQFFKKNKQKFDDRIEKSGVKEKAAEHYGKFRDFLNRQKPKLSGGLKTAGGYSKKAMEGAKQQMEKLSNALKENWKELRIKGETDPRITQAKMMAGHYVDAATNKVITKLTDIKGSVKDITTDTIVLKAEEIKDIVSDKLSSAKETAGNWYDRAKQRVGRMGIPERLDSFIKSAKDRWTEVYVKGENNPRIIKARLLAGKYYDAVSGKIIKTLDDIKGAVKDVDTDETILKEDELENSYVKEEDGTFRKFANFVKRTLGPLYSAFKSTRVGSFVAGGLEKAWGAVSDNLSMMKSIVYGAKDVWVEGEKYPRLTAVKMQQGHYTDAVSGKTIYQPSDIEGEVKDEKGETKIAVDELDRLMVYEGRSRRFAPIRKFLRGVGSVAGGIAWYYKKIGIPLTKFNFRMIAKASSVAFKSAQWLFDSGPYSVKDVYVGNEPEPRLYATKMKNGEYFNKSDSKPIYHQNDINGEVTDSKGTTLIFDEDMPNLRVYNSIMGLFNPFKPLKWIAQKAGQAAAWTIKQGFKATKFLTRQIGKAAMGITAGFVRYLSKPEDVYVKGETEPRLRAILMKVGRYISEKTGKIISVVDDIDGPVWDQEEKIRVIGNEDIEKGLVGQNGEPIKTTVMQDVIAGLKKVNKFFSYRGKLKIGEPLKPNKGMKDKEASTGEETVSLLGDIKGLFQDYFTDKKVKGDMDGDGDREGSWEDIKARRDAEKAKRDASKPGEAKKDTEKKGGLMGLLAGALDAITGFLGGFKTLFKAGGVLSGLGKLMGVGRVAGTVATAAGGMGTLGTLGAGLAAVVTNPVVLGIATAALVGYGAYKGYKALRKRMSKPSTLDTIRYTQYGFKKDNTSFFSKILDLEEYMKEFVKISSEQATINEKKMDIDEMMSIFGFSSKDNEHKRIYGTWYIKRFKPVYLTHVSALNMINGSTDLSKINDLKKEEKLKYIEATKFSSGPYTVTTLPVLDGSVTAATGADVNAAVEAALKEFSTQPGGSKSTGTGLPTDTKKPEDLKSNGRLDYGKTDAGRKLPGASVTGSSAIGAAIGANAVSAFDTVRFKTYGLKELEKGKVVSLIMLESLMAKKVSYRGTKATFDGNPNELLEKVTTYFGIPDLFSEAAIAWTKWFRDRFLPVYLNYATLHMQSVNKAPKADNVTLDPNQQYDIALALSATGGAWRVTDTPWEGYELNTNPDTVKSNLEYLKEALKQKTLREEQAKEDAKKQPPGAPPVKSAAVKAFQASRPEYNPPTSGSVSTSSTAPTWDRAGPAMGAGMGAGPTTEGSGSTKPDPTAKVPDPTGPGINGLKDTIVNAAKVVGIDPNIMLTTAAIESDFNPNAKAGTSSASGLMQFINSTWKETINKHGGKYGYDQSTSPFDAKASALMGAHYIKDSLSGLSKSYKGAISSVEAYLVHFMGPGGAAKFLKAMQENPGQYGSQLMPKEAAANQSIYFGQNGPRTLGEIYQWFYNKVRTKAARYGISLPASSGADTSEKSKYVMPGAGQNTGVVSEANKPNGNVTPITQETPKSSYNPTARPAAMQQQAVQASRQASTPLSDAVGFNPKAMGSGTETMNANKNTLTADIMKNTESILSQSLDVQKETLDVMKMIYEKINNIKAPDAAPKSEAKQYEAPKAPVPMRKSA